MATKAATKKKPTNKATTARKAPAKRTTRSSTSRSTNAKQAQMRSFRLYKETVPFTQTQITQQTVYWIILMGFIVAMQLWIIKLQLEIAQLTELLLVP